MPRPDPGGERAHRVADVQSHDIAIAIARLGTADKNRVLLALAAFIATQLEALEEENDA